MTAAMLPDDLEIAPGYTVGCWKKLRLNPDTPTSADWDTALKIFDERIRRRFLDPVGALIEAEKDRGQKMYGFAILAIDCLVIETLQGFREGKASHRGKSEERFANFLTGWDAFKVCLPKNCDSRSLAKRVYSGYRSALHHSGATDGAFRVGISGPVFDFKNEHEVKINRTCLHKELTREFETYLDDLCSQNGTELRRNFLKKMNAICGM